MYMLVLLERLGLRVNLQKNRGAQTQNCAAACCDRRIAILRRGLQPIFCILSTDRRPALPIILMLLINAEARGSLYTAKINRCETNYSILQCSIFFVTIIHALRMNAWSCLHQRVYQPLFLSVTRSNRIP
jgi:hypothetical protein